MSNQKLRKYHLWSAVLLHVFLLCTQAQSNWPHAVSDLREVGITTSEVHLEWNQTEPGPEFTYLVEVTLSNGSHVKDYLTSITEVKVDALQPGTKFNFTVTTRTADNTSASPQTVIYFTKPSRVTYITATGTTTNMTVTWDPPSGRVENYIIRIYRDSMFNTSQTVPSNSTSVTFSSLKPGQIHNVTVSTVSGAFTEESEVVKNATYPNPPGPITVEEQSTSLLRVSWGRPFDMDAGEYSFIVSISDNSSKTTENRTSFRHLMAGLPHTINIVTEGPLGYISMPVQRTVFTRPHAVSDLREVGITTSEVHLEWNQTEPGPEFTYLVEVTLSNGSHVKDDITSITEVKVDALQPGTKFNFTVTTRTADNTSASPQTVIYFTKPSRVTYISATGTTTNMTVTWDPPSGRVENYIIRIYRGSIFNTSQTVPSNSTSVTFSSLKPGQIHNVTVSTVSGAFTEESEALKNATYPNPPGPITVEEQTTSLLRVSWGRPFDMDAGEYSFIVSISDHSSKTTENRTSFRHLMAGLPHTINVVTEGPLGYISKPVQRTVFTRPKPVRDLQVMTLNSTAVFLKWTRPDPQEIAYLYRIRTVDDTSQRNLTVHMEEAIITNLTAGTNYSFMVYTQVGDETEGEPVPGHTYTKPSRVTYITATGTTTNMTVTWDPPSGRVENYIIRIYRGSMFNTSQKVPSNSTSVTFSSLKPGQIHNVTVSTVSGAFTEESEAVKNATYPNPPGPITVEEQTTSLLRVSWGRPFDMDAGEYSFIISISDNSSKTTENRTSFRNLMAGLPHTINIVTEGPLGYISMSVQRRIFTRPHAVSDLREVGITTSEVHLEWNQTEPGPEFTYLVEVTLSNGSHVKDYLTSITEVKVDALQPGTKFNFTVTTRTADNTSASPQTVIYFTRPKPVRDLQVMTLNTTAVCLKWTRPDPQENVYTYRIRTVDGTSQRNLTVHMEEAIITNLTEGTNYSFMVYTQVGDETEGEPVPGHTYTKPSRVTYITATGTTTNMTVKWDPPPGRVENYIIRIYRGSIFNTSQKVPSNSTSVTFSSLKPGQIHNVTVSTVSGAFTEESEAVKNATYPNPPGPITVEEQTTSLLRVSWSRPFDMDAGEYSFIVSISDNSSKTTENRTSFRHLMSGLPHTINIVTEGPLGYISMPVQRTVFTRPHAVIDLREVGITTSEVRLEWNQTEPGPEFTYLVEVTLSNGSHVKDDITSITEVKVDALQPGTKFNFTVTTRTADNTSASPQTVIYFTRPKPVRDLQVITLNSTAVFLKWTQPDPQENAYLYRIRTVDDTSERNLTVLMEEAIMTNLTAGTNYSFMVYTQVGDETEGEPVPGHTYTKPSRVTYISATGTTTNMTVMWDPPPGRVENYIIRIYRGSIFNTSQTVPSNSTSVTFSSLKPGQIHNVTVSTVSGAFTEESEAVKNATYPNPPGPITVEEQTTSLLRVSWSRPFDMDAGEYSFIVSISDNSSKTTENRTSFRKLMSGLPHTINVVTEGPLGYLSMPVQRTVFTRPHAVSDLREVGITTSEVHLEWNQTEPGPEFTYLVEVTLSNGSHVKDCITSITEVKVDALQPGTKFNFTVTTRTADNTSASPQTVIYFTRPKPVRDLQVITLNSTAVCLKWTGPDPQENAYLYRIRTVDGTSQRNLTVLMEEAIITNLTAGTNYSFMVYTQVGDETEGEPVPGHTYTKPSRVTYITATGTTTNMTVTWDPPSGRVENYIIRIYRDSIFNTSQKVPSNSTSVTFSSLKPGQIHNVTVSTVSGAFTEESEAVKNATYPNPPGPITVEEQTTSLLRVSWGRPFDMDAGEYRFIISISDNSSKTTENRTSFRNLMSGLPHTINVVTEGPLGYISMPVQRTVFTRPHAVSDLREVGITTSEVHLEWNQTEPGPEFTYLVEVTLSNGSHVKDYITSITEVKVDALQPGTKFNFTVTTRTADNTSASPQTVIYFTRPETVKPTVSNLGSNSSITVWWAPPNGRVERYVVLLVRSDGEILNWTLSASVNKSINESVALTGLRAAEVYTACVVSVSGPFGEESETATTATYPNPPGDIEIASKTTSSVLLKWAPAILMNQRNFSYIVTHSQYMAGHTGTNRTQNTQFTLSGLVSGSPYDISVATVGPLDFKSMAVRSAVTTRPKNVLLLDPQISNVTVFLKWRPPADLKLGYHYKVLVTNNTNSNISETLTPNTTHLQNNLDPGCQYNFTVRTLTSDETEGEAVGQTYCTDLSPVTATCEAPNRTNAVLMFSWGNPKGCSMGFEIGEAGMTSDFIEYCNPICNHKLTGLLYHKEYTVNITTLGCGKRGEHLIKCRTGITEPPIPNVETVARTKAEYQTFYLHLSSTFLNSTNGPVTHYGVLLTTNTESEQPNNADLRNNYSDWRNSNNNPYLTVLKRNDMEKDIQQISNSVIIVHIGDGSVQQLQHRTTTSTELQYKNEQLEPKRSYKYALVLFTRLVLADGLVDISQSIFSISSFSSKAVILLADPSVKIGIAVGVALGVIILLIFIIIVLFIFWRRQPKKDASDIPIDTIRGKVSISVKLEEYEAYFMKQRADSNCGFAEEFEDLKEVGRAQPKTNALAIANKEKNRYSNVLPYDFSRVILSTQGSPFDDYINANYMPGHNSSKEFIAAQGPLPGTVNEFWRMIWEKNVQTLVMLTRCNEQGRVKCERYWPSETKHYNNITVTTSSEVELEDWTIRDFDVKNVKTAETRSVRQFHFTAWPDHGVPCATELLINFRHLVREHMDQYSRHSPAVVHCSAGVGRTGTFIALDCLIFQINRESVVDVYGVVHEERMHRPLMVQTEDQYVFLNQCVMDIIKSRTGMNVDLIYQNVFNGNIKPFSH